MMVIAFAVVGIASSQDFVIGWEPGQPINLSGLDKSVFDGAMFMGDGWFMDPSSTMTPSMSAFMADNDADGKPMGIKTLKMAFVGDKTSLDDPREM